MNGICERWVVSQLLPRRDLSWFFELPTDPADLEIHDIPIKYQYITNPLDDDFEENRKYFLVSATNYQSATFVARRLLTHRIVDALSEEGWIHIRYDNNELIKDYLSFRSHPADFFQAKANYNRFGIKLLSHFVPYGAYGSKYTIEQAWSRPFFIFRAVFHLMYLGLDITRSSVVRYMTGLVQSEDGRLIRSPLMYKAILRELGIQNMVIADPEPGIGSKSLASVINNCGYYYGDDGPFAAGAQELSKFLGIKFAHTDEMDHFDVVFLDNNMHSDIEKLNQSIEIWRDKSDMVLTYCNDEDYEIIVDKWTPIDKLRLQTVLPLTGYFLLL